MCDSVSYIRLIITTFLLLWIIQVNLSFDVWELVNRVNPQP